jgi:hypothetical protein
VNLAYSLIASLGVLTVAAPVATEHTPLPVKAIVVQMCKHSYGVLITLDDGDLLMFTDPQDPLFRAAMKLVKKENLGVLEITPDFQCPVSV